MSKILQQLGETTKDTINLLMMNRHLVKKDENLNLFGGLKVGRLYH